MSDVEKLSQLLLQQAELSARREERAPQREERLSQMVERLVAVRPPPSAAASGETAPTQAAGTSTPTVRLPASATLAPHLSSFASLRDFAVWKEKLEGYLLLTGASTFPVKSQRAALLSLLDEDWHRVLRYGLAIAEDTALDDVIKAMEKHLRKQRNVMVDRRDFYSRVQEPGECFDDFMCSVKEIAAFCAFCENCMDNRMRDRVVCGVRDEDAVKRMLEDSELTLQAAIDICRASENARATCDDLRGAGGQSVARLSAYRRERS